MTDVLGLVGAGAMGGAIGVRLLETGARLAVFDLDPAKREALVARGAVAAVSAAEAARGARAVILSLNAPRIVRAAVFGPGGVAEGAQPGTLVIDMSSIDPESTKALAADAAARGLRWVDSPLSGGIPKAALGELTLMQGGAEADVAEAQAVLDDPALAPLFAPGTLAEVTVTGTWNGRQLLGSVDRLVITRDRVLIVDYKSNALIPDRPDQVPEGILRQLGAYAHVLAQAYPDRRVETAILWTRAPRLMSLDPMIVRAALARATMP